MPGLFKSKQTTKQDFTRKQTPTELPEWQGLGDLLRSTITQRMQNPGDFLRGYEESGLQNINRTFDVLRRGQENQLTARGLAGSPVAAGSDLRFDLGRGSQIADFQSRIPLLERDIQNQDIGLGMSLFGQRPIGQTSSGQSSSETVMSPSLMSSIMSMASMGAGLGAFKPLSGLFGQKSPSQYGMG